MKKIENYSRFKGDFCCDLQRRLIGNNQWVIECMSRPLINVDKLNVNGTSLRMKKLENYILNQITVN